MVLFPSPGAPRLRFRVRGFRVSGLGYKVLGF
jgi:hypothetical protein